MIRTLNRIETWLASFCLAGFSLVILLGVFMRYFFGAPLVWIDEVAIYLLIASVYIGASIGVLDGQHFRVTALVDQLPRRLAAIVRSIVLLVWLIFNLVVAWQGGKIVAILLKTPYVSPALGVPQQWPYLLLPVGFALMALKVALLVQEEWRHGNQTSAEVRPSE